MSKSLRTVWRQTVATLAFLLAGSVLAAERPATEGAVPGQWTMDFDAACQVAAAKKLPIFINFTGSDWCGWCKLMDTKVFSQAPWQAYAKERLLLVWIDFPQDKALVPEKFVARNQALAKQFGVEGYPAYILLDDDGKSLLGQLGADRDVTPGRFMAQVREVLSNRTVEVEKLLASMPAAAAQDYRSTAAQLQQARAEQQALEAAYTKKNAELDTQITAQAQRLKTLRLNTLLAKLPKEQAAAYTAKQERATKVTAELKAWLATRPERNEANREKFTAWSKELATLETEMAELLSP
ncbi:MAG: thioredoxin family protein [Lentisphaeria bacterium]